MMITKTTDPAIRELAGVVWRLDAVADHALEAAGRDKDVMAAMLSVGAQVAACQSMPLLGEDAGLCSAPASSSTDPATLLHEVEQVLASRPIEEWPEGTSGLITAVYDLIREHGL